MNPLVSIIIPCFNAESFVGEAIESALAQSYTNVEIIVIDDGSIDGSLDVIRSFGDRITWETGPNRGAAAARNRGVFIANGQILQFLDADDVLEPSKLARQVPLLVGGVAHLVGCRMDLLVPGATRMQPPRSVDPRLDDIDILDYLGRGGTLSCPGPILWKKSFFSVGGFREDLPCCQEYDLHLRLAARGATAVRLDEILVHIRKVPGSVSSDRVRLLEQRNKLRREIWQLLSRSGEMAQRYGEAFAAGTATDARAFLRRGMRKNAEECFALARQFHPSGGVGAAYSPVTRLLRLAVGADLTEEICGPFRCVWRITRQMVSFSRSPRC